ncbi:proline-rich proteoglycan 2-like isoform X2 [Pimephales promelas]|uniref:proline-rich proteoglycan 2-like isoform X1 n=1 Tax=Pimephales promelas TaxID=90988 RepID=UPI001955D6AE|nr:proline-rich proteoglycan 2-like isoform X1 [Pimephales promelas]XP_039547740.1 proline-rich proteoglycan 2-like isoform X2 [Pimephales promelas]
MPNADKRLLWGDFALFQDVCQIVGTDTGRTVGSKSLYFDFQQLKLVQGRKKGLFRPWAVGKRTWGGGRARRPPEIFGGPADGAPGPRRKGQGGRACRTHSDPPGGATGGARSFGTPEAVLQRPPWWSHPRNVPRTHYSSNRPPLPQGVRQPPTDWSPDTPPSHEPMICPITHYI